MLRGCSKARRALHWLGLLRAAGRHRRHPDACSSRVAAAVEPGQWRGDLGELELSARSGARQGVGRGAGGGGEGGAVVGRNSGAGRGEEEGGGERVVCDAPSCGEREAVVATVAAQEARVCERRADLTHDHALVDRGRATHDRLPHRLGPLLLVSTYGHGKYSLSKYRAAPPWSIK